MPGLSVAVATLPLEALSDPAAAVGKARDLALTPDLTAEDRASLLVFLQPWWDGEQDAQNLLRYLGERGSKQGHGSPEHRFAVRLAVLCVRTVLYLVREQDHNETGAILDTLDAWARGDAPGTDLDALRDRAWALWNETDSSSDDATAETDAASSADDAVAAAASLAAGAFGDCESAAINAACATASTVHARGTPAWMAARSRCLADLADLIRAAVPVCPVGPPRTETRQTLSSDSG